MEGDTDGATLQFGDVGVALGADHVAIVELQRPPDNPVDVELVRSLADAFDHLEADLQCRAIVLCSAGKHFSAGARLGGTSDPIQESSALDQNPLYDQAVRLFRGSVPIVAAVHGAAVGAGLGLVLAADFRVVAAQARLAANFARLGFHPGFGISATLPRAIGEAAAADLLYTGRRIGGEEAVAIGLCQRLAPLDQVRAVAHAWAADIAGSAPLAVRAIRRTLRTGLADLVQATTRREHAEQVVLRATGDYTEGVRAYAERRPGDFAAC
jgi:2-(1,2-epoxy-1,2-dihydrophenyl)acetyl-CoA isomerase